MKQNYMEALLQEVLSDCKELKIPVSDRVIPEIIINRRAKSRFGSCKKTAMGFQIEICEAVLDASVQDIKNIIAHELLHTCYGCYNHGKRWKAYAEKMNNMHGYNITTTTTYEKIGLERPERKPDYKYKIECTKCGKVFFRQKKSKLITNTKRYRCTCGGKLKYMEI